MRKHELIFGKTMTIKLMEETRELENHQYAFFIMDTDITKFMIELYLKTNNKPFFGRFVDELIEERNQHLESKGEF